MADWRHCRIPFLHGVGLQLLVDIDKTLQTMPVPFESLIPLGIITAMFTVTGGLLYTVKRSHNNSKPPRHHLDRWDELLMERDQRLTGEFRGNVRFEGVADKNGFSGWRGGEERKEEKAQTLFMKW